ncbi:MAG: hypothetical protein EKK55_10150 [Rhodocyclaceae bacterium]|nr:MAG: hypothetical protein EKK55_10150 [Rhodocyclaceae bacterium]
MSAPLITPEIVETIVALVRTGLAVKFVAGKAGVNRSTIYDWLAKGEADDPPESAAAYVEFARRYRAAEADYAVAALKAIDDARNAELDWKSDSWKLSKRFPGEYGDKLALEHSGPEGGAIQHDVSARVVVLPPIKNAADLDDSVGAHGATGGVPVEPR